MRNDAAAKERRRQRAQARMAPVIEEPMVNESKHRVPHTVNDMLAFATELGWSFERKRNGYLLKHPSGQTASLHLTPSDVAAWRNLRCQLLRPHRRGLTVVKDMLESPYRATNKENPVGN